MHLVVCMSPIGDAFRNRLRQYPSLINCTTIDWFLEWPREALLEVGNKFLMNLNLTLTITGENKAVGLRLRLLPLLSGRSIPFDSDFSGIETPPLKRKREGRVNHIHVLSISWNPIIFLSTTHPHPVWQTSFRNAIVQAFPATRRLIFLNLPRSCILLRVFEHGTPATGIPDFSYSLFLSSSCNLLAW